MMMVVFHTVHTPVNKLYYRAGVVVKWRYIRQNQVKCTEHCTYQQNCSNNKYTVMSNRMVFITQRRLICHSNSTGSTVTCKQCHHKLMSLFLTYGNCPVFQWFFPFQAAS